jgi:F420H(2)-dependent quinone reductase
MRSATARRLSRIHAGLYRATGGRIGRRLVDNDMLLLTTTGRRSGRPHTVPLLYLADGDRLVVIASWGGKPGHPHWYHNLVAEPRAVVQIRSRRFPVVARTAGAAERAAWWPRVVAAYDGYAGYQARTDREIPVVFLDPAGG